MKSPGASNLLLFLTLGPWEFAIEFSVPTKNIPILSDKKIPILDRLTVCWWFKLNNDRRTEHVLFTVPKHNDGFQPRFYKADSMKFWYKKVYSPIFNFPSSDLDVTRSWNHMCVTVEEQGAEDTSFAFYMNGGKFKMVGLVTATERTGPPAGVDGFYASSGVVLGNDVGNQETINQAEETFNGAVTELYVFKSLLSFEQIREIYAHHYDHVLANRIVSWEEFRGSADGIVAREVDYPL